MSVTLNGNTYAASDFVGSSGRGYAEIFSATGLQTFPESIFTDMLAELAGAATVQSVTYGAAGGILVSDGSQWKRAASATITDAGAATFTSMVSSGAVSAQALLNVGSTNSLNSSTNRIQFRSASDTARGLIQSSYAALGDLYIFSEGNQDIGLSAGSGQIQLASDVVAQGTITVGSATENTPLTTQAADGNFHWGIKTAGGVVGWGIYTTSGLDFVIYRNGVGAGLTLDASRNATFGGAADFAARLGVAGDVGVAQGQSVFLDGTAATGDTYLQSPSANAIRLVAGGTGTNYMDLSGNTRAWSIGGSTAPYDESYFNFAHGGAANVYLQRVYGYNSTPASVEYGRIEHVCDVNTAASEDSRWIFYVQSGGTLTRIMDLAKNGVLLQTLQTTGSAANLECTGAGSAILRSTSTLRGKDILDEPMTVDWARSFIGALAPFWYTPKKGWGDTDRTYPGLGAEHIDAMDGPNRRFVSYFDGEPSNVDYARLTLPLALVVSDLDPRVAELEKWRDPTARRIAHLESEIERLDGELNDLRNAA